MCLIDCELQSLFPPTIIELDRKLNKGTLPFFILGPPQLNLTDVDKLVEVDQ